MSCERTAAFEAKPGQVFEHADGPLHVAVRPGDGISGARLVLLHDLSFISRRSAESRNYLVYLFLGLGLAISLITVAVAHFSWRGWERGIRALLRGELPLRPAGRDVSPELRPIATDLRKLVDEIEHSARQRDEAQISWTAETLRGLLSAELHGSEVIVLSNREPYLHVRKGGGIEVQRPASGLVTAIEGELMKDGYVFRYVEADDFGHPKNAFLVCTFWYIGALAALGLRDEARARFETLLAARSRLGLFGEHIDPSTGEQWGNFVQTYSMVGLINTAIRLSIRWDQAF